MHIPSFSHDLKSNIQVSCNARWKLLLRGRGKKNQTRFFGPGSCGMETSGKKPQRVCSRLVMGSCCDAQARSATRAVDRAGVAQDTQQFRLRRFALVRREPW